MQLMRTLTFLTSWILTEAEVFNLTILHLNDIHMRIEETNAYGSDCKVGSHCFGGMERLSYLIKMIRRSVNNTLLLFGGDFFQGTIYYTHYRWKMASLMSNALEFDVMAIGNHEFDDTVLGFFPYLDGSKTPLVCANIDVSMSPMLANKIKKSAIVHVANKTIGVIGYITVDTAIISRPEKTIKFLDEVESIREEAKLLREKGVDIIIALGHSGYSKDKDIAKSVEEVDVVVGGHSHSFLYSTQNGVHLSNDKPVGKYPTIVIQESGKEVPVVQAFAYTKYLGYLELIFDQNNTLKGCSGSPILIDEDIPKDPEMTLFLKPYKEEIYYFKQAILGFTEIPLISNRNEETSLGNFITDCMTSLFDANTTLAVINSGGIRASLDIGNISRADVLTVFPFDNNFNAVKLKGAALRAGFEKGASRMKPDGTNTYGEFFQESGFQLFFDVTCEENKLIHVKVRDPSNFTRYIDLVDDEIYTVVMSSFVLGSQTGFSLFGHENFGVEADLTPDHMVLSSCFKKSSPIRHKDVGNRIKIITTKSSKEDLRRFLEQISS